MRELIEASVDIDVPVLGSRDYGPIRTVLLGIVSRALVRSAGCPVVVVPRGTHGVGAAPQWRSMSSGYSSSSSLAGTRPSSS